MRPLVPKIRPVSRGRRRVWRGGRSAPRSSRPVASLTRSPAVSASYQGSSGGTARRVPGSGSADDTPRTFVSRRDERQRRAASSTGSGGQRRVLTSPSSEALAMMQRAARGKDGATSESYRNGSGSASQHCFSLQPGELSPEAVAAVGGAWGFSRFQPPPSAL